MLSDFCAKRIAHMKKLMGEQELGVICLLKSGRRGGSTFKRLANTTCGNALIIPLEEKPTLVCSTADAIDCSEEAYVNVHDRGSTPSNTAIIDMVNGYFEGDLGKIGWNPGGLDYKTYNLYSSNLKGGLVPIERTILPEVLFGPYPEELKYQRRVSAFADIGVQAIHDCLRPGISEVEVAAEACYVMRKAGAESISFCIVNSGPDSAHIHGLPSDRKVEDGDLLMADLGPVKHGYLADITRTFLVGEDAKKRHMLEAMDKSVQAVLDAIKPGVSCRELDAISRRVLLDHGYPDYPHSLGHPVSGFVKPGLSKRSEDIERVGYVHTVEPGIYTPGFGGVRFEENVYVTEDGYEMLFKSPRLF